VHPLFSHLHTCIARSLDIDFTTLFAPDPEWESQKSIPFSKKIKLLSCAIYLDFDIPRIIRYLGGQYTGDDRNVTEIINYLQGIVPDETVTQIKNILTTGAPTVFHGESSVANFLDYWRYGNHKSITDNKANIEKVMNKEDKHKYLLPFPCWLARFIPNMHVTPQGLVVKPGKNDRLVFDASHLIKFYSICCNMMTTPSKEPKIEYGTAFQRHLKFIYNLRITHPHEDILLYSDDVSGAFRWPRLNPFIASAFSFLFFGTLYVPVGQVFGGNTSAQNFEPIAKARTILAQHLFQHGNGLVEKHKTIIDKVKFIDVPPNNTNFTQVKPCELNQGVQNQDGSLSPPPFTMFVDDLLHAEIRARMKLSLAASIESLTQTMGPDIPTIRRSNLSLDKYFEIVCSFVQTQLGLEVNTRHMTVTLPKEKKDNLILLLKHWHKSRKSFVIKEASSLLGKLNYAAEVAPWARFLFCAIRNSLLHVMRKNRKIVMGRSRFKQLIIDANDGSNDNIALLRRKFAISHLAKAIWNCNEKCFINNSLREELNLLIDIITSNSIQWSMPIAHLIPRIPDYQAWGDASLTAAGGFSIDLGFYWYLAWPHEIRSKTLKFFTKNMKHNGELISINLLEYIVVIINYAICTYIFNTKNLNSVHQHHTLLNWSDNKSAIAWTKQAAISTTGGKALSRIFCSICINNDLSCTSDYINTKKNIIADDLSRIKFASPKSFSLLLQAHPVLNSCEMFPLNPEFISCLTHAVLSGHSPPLQMLPGCRQ